MGFAASVNFNFLLSRNLLTKCKALTFLSLSVFEIPTVYLEGRKGKLLSRVRLFATPWTVAYQAPSMRFSRQEYWSGLPFPSPEDLPNPGIKPSSPALAGGLCTTREAQYLHMSRIKIPKPQSACLLLNPS